MIFKIINEQYEGMRLFLYNFMVKYKFVLYILRYKVVIEFMKFLYIFVENIYGFKIVVLSCFQLEYVIYVIIIIVILQY